MTDACVKYDSEKKLWLYLHSDRNYEHPGWGEDGEDYLEKGPSKKKKRDFEWNASSLTLIPFETEYKMFLNPVI